MILQGEIYSQFKVGGNEHVWQLNFNTRVERIECVSGDGVEFSEKIIHNVVWGVFEQKYQSLKKK